MEHASTLLIEPFGGMAGDMLLAALLDLGDERFALEDLRGLAEALVPGESRIETQRAWRGSLSGLLLSVHTGEGKSPPHRGLAECAARIEGSPLSPEAKRRAARVFRRIAEAEARVHGTTAEEIHFHEVGAADALIDVCGAALAIERLGIERVLATPPLVGSGTVRCAHGEMPVPAPGTAELMRGLPVRLGGGGERLTPTGAALLAEYAGSFEPAVGFIARAIGYGAGHRDPREGPPNLLRVQMGEVLASAPRGTAWLLETNLDDMTGEEIGFALEALRAAGALEAWTAPVQMKKDRPGVVLSALCREESRAELERAAFAHTTTLGVRWRACERAECDRETLEVELLGRTVRVKRRIRPGASPSAADLSPEHDDLAALARETGRNLRDLERAAVEACLQRASGDGGPASASATAGP